MRLPELLVIGAIVPVVVLTVVSLEAAEGLIPALAATTLFALAIVVVPIRIPSAARRLMFVAFALRAGFALVNLRFNLIEPRNATDIFDPYGWQLAQALREFSWPERWVTSPPIASYSFVVGVVYAIVGHVPSVILIINSLIDAINIGLIYRIGKSCFNRSAAMIAGTLAAFSPYMVWMAGTFLRESLTRFMILGFLSLLLAGMASHRPERYYALATLQLVATLALRPENAPCLIALFLGALLGTTPSTRRLGPKFVAILMLGTLLAVILVTVLSVNTGLFFNFRHGMSIDSIDSFRGHHAKGGSGYLPELKYGSWASVVTTLPLRVAYFLFVPFPWQITNRLQAFAFLDTIMMVFLFAVSLKALPALMRARDLRVRALLAYFCMGVVSYALVESNAGSALRHRRQFTFVLMLLASSTLSREKSPRFTPSRWDDDQQFARRQAS